MNRVLIGLCLSLIAALTPAHAQDPFPADETPEAVAQQYVEAMRASDWNKAALLMHPEALKSIRALVQPIIESAKTEKDRQEMAGIFGIGSQTELAQMSDTDVYAKFMSGIMGMVPDMRNILNSSGMQLIGKVGEKGDLQHIVFRMTVKIDLSGATGEAIPFSKLDVMTLRRFEKTWRLELKGDIEGVMKAMVAGLAKRATEEAAATEEAPKPKPAAKAKRPVRKK